MHAESHKQIDIRPERGLADKKNAQAEKASKGVLPIHEGKRKAAAHYPPAVEDKSDVHCNDSTFEESASLGKRRPKLEEIEELRAQLQKHEALIQSQQAVIHEHKSLISEFTTAFGELAANMMKMSAVFSKLQGQTIVPKPKTTGKLAIGESHQLKTTGKSSPGQQHRSKQSTQSPDRPIPQSKSDASDAETDNLSREVTDPASVPDQQKIHTPSKILPEVVSEKSVKVKMIVASEDAITKSGKKKRGQSNSRSKGKQKSATKAEDDEELMLDEEGSDSNHTQPAAEQTSLVEAKPKGKPGRKPSAATLQQRAQKQAALASELADPAPASVSVIPPKTLITLAVENGAVSVLNGHKESVAKVVTAMTTSGAITPSAGNRGSLQPGNATPAVVSAIKPAAVKSPNASTIKPANTNAQGQSISAVKVGNHPIAEKPKLSQSEKENLEVGEDTLGKRPRSNILVAPEDIEQEEKELAERDKPHTNLQRDAHVQKSKEKRRDLLNRSMTVSKETSERKYVPREGINELRKGNDTIKDRDLRKIQQLESLAKVQTRPVVDKQLARGREEFPGGTPLKPKVGPNSLNERSLSIKPKSSLELAVSAVSTIKGGGVRVPESARNLGAAVERKQPGQEQIPTKKSVQTLPNGKHEVVQKRKIVITPQNEAAGDFPLKLKPQQSVSGEKALTGELVTNERESQPKASAKGDGSAAKPDSVSKTVSPPKGLSDGEKPQSAERRTAEREQSEILVSKMAAEGEAESKDNIVVGGVDVLEDGGSATVPVCVKLEPGTSAGGAGEAKEGDKGVASKDIFVMLPSEDFDVDASNPVVLAPQKLPPHVKIEDTGNGGELLSGKSAPSLGLPLAGQTKESGQIQVKREPDSGPTAATKSSADSYHNDRTKALQVFKGTSSTKGKDTGALRPPGVPEPPKPSSTAGKPVAAAGTAATATVLPGLPSGSAFGGSASAKEKRREEPRRPDKPFQSTPSKNPLQALFTSADKKH